MIVGNLLEVGFDDIYKQENIFEEEIKIDPYYHTV